MKNFKSGFIIQFAIDFAVFGIIYTIISRVLTGVAVNLLDMTGKNICYSIVLLQNIFITLAVVSALFVTQKVISKKDVSCLDDPKRFYFVFGSALGIIGIIISFLGLSAMNEVCKNNVDPFKMISDLREKEPSLFIDDINEQIDTTIKNAVLVATIISDVIYTAALMGISILLHKRHEKIFKKKSLHNRWCGYEDF